MFRLCLALSSSIHASSAGLSSICTFPSRLSFPVELQPTRQAHIRGKAIAAIQRPRPDETNSHFAIFIDPLLCGSAANVEPEFRPELTNSGNSPDSYRAALTPLSGIAAYPLHN